MELCDLTPRYRHVSVDGKFDVDYDLALITAIGRALDLDQIKLHRKTMDTAAKHAEAFTVCELVDENGAVFAIGFSFWTRSPDRPSWNRIIANKIALGRARRRFANKHADTVLLGRGAHA